MMRLIIPWRELARWWPPLTATVAAAVALAGLVASQRSLESAALAQTRQQAQLRGQLTVADGAAFPECAPEIDFVQALPQAVSIDKLVQSLQDSSRTFGVILASVSSEPRPATVRTLAQLEVNIVLRGRYQATKSALSEALARYPGAVIERLRMKRTGGQPAIEDVDAQIVLPQRPAMPVLDCRLRPLTSGVPPP
jgi:hypothetical protein